MASFMGSDSITNPESILNNIIFRMSASPLQGVGGKPGGDFRGLLLIMPNPIKRLKPPSGGWGQDFHDCTTARLHDFFRLPAGGSPANFSYSPINHFAIV
jgi:hypothetical protein